MDFKEATDILTRRITADEIAEAAGVSISSIARARLDPSSSAYRSPPENWEAVLARLARERIKELSTFAQEMELKTNAGNEEKSVTRSLEAT